MHLSVTTAILPLSKTEVLVYYIDLFSYCVCVLKVHACYGMCVWRSKDSLQKVVLSFTIGVPGLSDLTASTYVYS